MPGVVQVGQLESQFMLPEQFTRSVFAPYVYGALTRSSLLDFKDVFSTLDYSKTLKIGLRDLIKSLCMKKV